MRRGFLVSHPSAAFKLRPPRVVSLPTVRQRNRLVPNALRSSLPRQSCGDQGYSMKAVFLIGLISLGLTSAAPSAYAALLISVDKSAQTLTVTRDGQTIHNWPVSTGKPGYATPSGNFTTFRMEADHYSKEWDDAPMPHSVFFTKQGHAIHGSYDVKRLGSPASHGCVRLAPANALKLFALVKEEGLPNTQVVLTGSEQIALDHTKARRTASSARHPPDRARSRERRSDGVQKRSAQLPRPQTQFTPFDGYAASSPQPGFIEPPRSGYSSVPRDSRSRYVDPDQRSGYDARGAFFN